MPKIAIISGAVAFLAGLVKYILDYRAAKRKSPVVTVSMGDESIQLPSSYSPTQIEAAIKLLKDNAMPSQAAK